MAEFFSFLKVVVFCSTTLFFTMMVLLALPQSKLRSVGLEMSKWALAVGLLLLVPSPIDVVPDVIPGIGWLDDLGYLVAAGFAVKSAFGERSRRAFLEELEFNQMVAEKQAAISSHDEEKKEEA